MAVLLGGVVVFIVAASDSSDLGLLSTKSDLRQPARWCYAVIAILSFVISMGDVPRNRRDAESALGRASSPSCSRGYCGRLASASDCSEGSVGPQAATSSARE